MNKVGTLIIGLGNIAVNYDRFIKKKNFYHTHSKSILKSRDFELLGGSDILKKKRDKFSEIYKKPSFKSIDYPLKHLRPKLVVLSTPTNNHYQSIKKIINYNCVKYIFCEKPLSNNLKEAKKIVYLCKKKRIKLFVNYFRISEPSSIKLKKIFKNKNKIIGKVFYSRGYFNNSSHFFNLFEYIFGEFKTGSLTGKPTKYKKNDLNCNYYSIFGNAKIYFFYKNNKFDQFKFDINYDGKVIKYRKNGEKIIKLNNKSSKSIIINSMRRYQLNVYDQISNYLNKKKYYLCMGKDALKTLNNMYKVLKNEKF